MNEGFDVALQNSTITNPSLNFKCETVLKIIITLKLCFKVLNFSVLCPRHYNEPCMFQRFMILTDQRIADNDEALSS